MLFFNELRLLQDKKYILIDIQVRDLPQYKNVYINNIEVHTLKDFNTVSFINGKSIIPPTTFIPSIDLNDSDLNLKHYRGYIPVDGCSEDLFFVCVSVWGDITDNIPCATKENIIVGVVYNKQVLYQKGMSLLSQLQGCQPADDLKDFILLKKAFDMSLQAGNYENVRKYWNLLTQTKETMSISKCGCHGAI